MVIALNDEKRCITGQTRESPSPRSSSGHFDAFQPDSEMRTARNSFNEELDGKTEVGLSPARHAHHFGYRQEYLSPEHLRATINARLANPLAGFTQQQLSQRGEDFALKYGMLETEDVRAFRLGAMLAQDSTRYAAVEELTLEEKNRL